MRIVLEPGDWIFDTAGKPDFQAAYDAGYKGWSAYPTGKWRATQTMVDDALDVGLVIQWNQEGIGNEGLQGYDGGRRMAEQAIPAIEAFGWRINETPIVYSLTDVGISDSQMPTIRDAYRACWELSWSGGYGPLNVMHDLSNEAPSNFVLWHWGGDRPLLDWPFLHCQQVYPPRSGFGVSYDHNYLIRPLTMWAGPGIDPPPSPIGVQVPGFVGFANDPNHGIVKFVLCNDGAIRWLPTVGEEAAVYAQYPNGNIPAADVSTMSKANTEDDARWLAQFFNHSHNVSGTAT